MSTAIVKQKKSALEKAEENLSLIRAACVGLSEQIVSLKKPESMGRCLINLKAVGNAIDDMKSGLEERVKELIEAKGSVVTEKGSKELSVNGVTLTMRPTRTGLDPKKLERLLRERKLKLTDYMDEQVTVTYKVNQSKLDMQSIAKKLTDADLAQCMYDTTYALQPVKVEDTDE